MQNFFGVDVSSRHHTILDTVHETIFRLIFVAVIEKNDDRNSYSDLKNYLLEYLRTLVGINTNDVNFKNSWLLKRLGKKIIFRFFHSGGNSVDFKFTTNGSLTNLSITNGTKATGYRCITIDLDDILSFEEHSATKRILAITTKYKIAKVNKIKKSVRYLSLFLDRNFQALIYHITAFIIKTAIRSAFLNLRRY